MKLHRVPARLVFMLSWFLLAAFPAIAQDVWKPIDPADLAKGPTVEAGADAEAIFWDVQVDFGTGKTTFENYIRIKVFTERGKELCSTVELRYFSKNKIEDIAGRTIKADGTIVELKKEAIFDSTLVKLRRLNINAKTFAMPAVEQGGIIEYRWREVRNEGYFARLSFQRTIPIQLVKYTLKIPSGSLQHFRGRAFNMESSPMVPEKDKRFSYSMTNVRAFHEEPQMPPEDQVRSWMLVYFQPSIMTTTFNQTVYSDFKARAKVNDEIKRTAQAVIGDASLPDQKLERLFLFCKNKIKNISDDASDLTGDDLAKLKENKSAADTLKRGMGTAEDIDILFGALAIAAGFEARLARVADRSDIFYRPDGSEFLLNLYFMRSSNIAIQAEHSWRFFDPGSQYVPLGMLRWQEEAGRALIVDPVFTMLAKTPVSSAEKSIQKRTATLLLTEDGTLEGDVRIEYTGHCAVEKKEENDDESAEQREKTLRDKIKERMSTAELSQIQIENATDPTKPFVYSFHIRVPGYAQRTGKRLFLQPAFFQKGTEVLFSASKRKHDIYFHYLWMEDDTVTIDLPPGFALDNADAPAPLSAKDVADYKVKISVAGKSEAIHYRRTFRFDSLIFPVASYPVLKRLFDAIYQGDNHTITLKHDRITQ